MPKTPDADYDQEYRIADITELSEHPQNPNQGDVGAIVTSIEQNGVYRALSVQKSTGHVLAGNHTLKALRALGHTRVPIIEKDCDDATALRILLADNRTAQLATYDDFELLELLKREAERDNLAGTGWDGDDVDALRERLEDTTPFTHDPKGDADQTAEMKCPECGHTWTEIAHIRVEASK